MLALALPLMGCAGTADTPPTAREGRDDVVAFVIDSAAQLDHITEWAPDAVAYAQGCGGSGASYNYATRAPQGDDPVSDAKVIAEYWESLGMSVRTTNADSHPTVYASGGPVLRASFNTSAVGDTYDLGAVMACGTGNAIDLNAEDQARRDAGEVLPGDEGVIPWEEKYPSTTPTPSETD